MLTARDILAPGTWDSTTACDLIELDYDERHRRRFHFTAQGGTAFLLDLPRAAVLREGDGLRLSDGRTVLVRAAPEALMEARAHDLHALLRLAWHIGNRHLPAQITTDAILLRQDHVIRAMLLGLGAHVRDVEAPFTPEQGAYTPAERGHGRGNGDGHGHGHGHGHHHHDHEDAGGHSHEHHSHAG
jgi:urease accessory protein